MIGQFGTAYTPERPLRGLWGTSRRSVFVVDETRTVRYAWVTDDPRTLPDVEEILLAVRAVVGR